MVDRAHGTQQEKMTRGALIFAYDNEHIDYQALAAWSADNIHRHLEIPVAIVTDGVCRFPDKFDKIIQHDRRDDAGRRNFQDTGLVTWHNTNRMDAYSLTPWDHTLLLDADYVIASPILKTLFDFDGDLLAHQQAYDIASLNDFSGLNYFGSYRMPMSWATVIVFRQSQYAQSIFHAMAMIRDNWRHFVRIYHSGNSVYRNDHSLSIALGISNGHWLNYPTIPWSLATVMPDHVVVKIDTDHYRIDYTDTENRRRWIDFKNQDFHAMGKKHLGDIVANDIA